jgi:pimeloyl-ACP methyl ester carboxylesterase
MQVRVRRVFADTAEGQIHYAEAGSGSPVLLLHQTPRSWDEYRDVLPLLGRTRRAVAMDMLGFGDSVKPPGEATIERYARGAVALLDTLGIDRAPVVGHHTGAVVAMELAARHPHRVERLVLSAAPMVDAEDRERAPERPPVDEVEQRPDGGHLTELWQRRARFYPPDRPDLLHRFVLDALKVLDRVEEGHRAVHRYIMEDALARIQAPTLLMAGTEDPYAHPHLARLAAALPGSEVVEIPGGMVPMVDQMPEAFAETVLAFLDRS